MTLSSRLSRRLTTVGLAAATALAVGGGLLTSAGAALPDRAGVDVLPATAQEALARGDQRTGLVRSRSPRCAGGYHLMSPDPAVARMCTHGADLAPRGVDVRRTDRGAAALLEGGTTAVPLAPLPSGVCGTDGPRVQAVYVRVQGQPDRYDALRASIQGWALKVDGIFAASARATGGVRHVRFATGADCLPAVARAVVSTRGDDSLQAMVRELRRKGFRAPGTKYLVWADAAVLCGMATAISDDSPGATNKNNTDVGYARVDRACWGGKAEAHELGHLLGAVQTSAPHSNGAMHCTDENDIMCYSQAGAPVTYPCGAALEESLDCRHDDYFHTAPPPGSYLATHWNVARSRYLWAG